MKNSWKQHECEKLPSTGVQILYAMDNVERNAMTWRLIIRREATEEDLEENHHLEEEGETLWETSLEILHCPFCGKHLLEKKTKFTRITEDLAMVISQDGRQKGNDQNKGEEKR